MKNPANVENLKNTVNLQKSDISGKAAKLKNARRRYEELCERNEMISKLLRDLLKSSSEASRLEDEKRGVGYR